MANDGNLRQVVPLSIWPTCPQRERRRTAVCPVCATAGCDFQLGWGDSAAGTVELNDATADLAQSEEESEDLLVICPGCDESFRPGFLRRCEWCGHRFDAGVVADMRPVETLNSRVLATIGGVTIIVVALLAYFAIVLP